MFNMLHVGFQGSSPATTKSELVNGLEPQSRSWFQRKIQKKTARKIVSLGVISTLLFLLVLNVGNGRVAGGCWDDYY